MQRHFTSEYGLKEGTGPWYACSLPCL